MNGVATEAWPTSRPPRSTRRALVRDVPTSIPSSSSVGGMTRPYGSRRTVAISHGWAGRPRQWLPSLRRASTTRGRPPLRRRPAPPRFEASATTPSSSAATHRSGPPSAWTTPCESRPTSPSTGAPGRPCPGWKSRRRAPATPSLSRSVRSAPSPPLDQRRPLPPPAARTDRAQHRPAPAAGHDRRRAGRVHLRGRDLLVRRRGVGSAWRPSPPPESRATSRSTLADPFGPANESFAIIKRTR